MYISGKTPRARRALFAGVYRALRPGGAFAFPLGAPQTITSCAVANVCAGVAGGVEAGQAWLVDVRVKTFASETADRLGFLHSEFGFTDPVTVPGGTGPYLLVRRVRFERPDLAIEISLVLSYMGEEYVAADLVAEDESGSVRRTEIGRSTAHTGYQMRHALDLQAQAVRRALGGHMPTTPG